VSFRTFYGLQDGDAHGLAPADSGAAARLPVLEAGPDSTSRTAGEVVMAELQGAIVSTVRTELERTAAGLNAQLGSLRQELSAVNESVVAVAAVGGVGVSVGGLSTTVAPPDGRSLFSPAGFSYAGAAPGSPARRPPSPVADGEPAPAGDPSPLVGRAVEPAPETPTAEGTWDAFSWLETSAGNAGSDTPAADEPHPFALASMPGGEAEPARPPGHRLGVPDPVHGRCASKPPRPRPGVPD
jgi:hypothetical protein